MNICLLFKVAFISTLYPYLDCEVVLSNYRSCLQTHIITLSGAELNLKLDNEWNLWSHDDAAAANC